MVTDDPRLLAQDWITIWQSECAATATDRERTEAWAAAAAVWAGWARMVAGPPAGPAQADGPAGPAAPVPPAGTAAAADAPDARDRVIAGLAERVDELERRLAGAAR